MTISLLIESLDVLLFRDGKPFSAGMDHLAQSIFPPFPTTLTGFIRSKLFLESDLNWDRARQQFGNLGGPDGYGSFRIRGLFLRKDGIDYVPVPMDFVKGKNSGEYRFISPIQRSVVPDIAANFPDRDLLHLWVRTDEPVETPTGFIHLSDLFDRCLLGRRLEAKSILSDADFIAREPRTQISVDRASRTANDGGLFTVEFLRPLEEVGFHARFEGVQWPGRSGLDTLGGERRPVRWTVLDRWTPPGTKPIEEKVQSSGRFKLVLLAPAVFDEGWHPGQRFNGYLKEVSVEAKLVAAAVGRPVRIGGFDLHRGTPKPMRPAVPAGSVYFYEINSGDPARLVGSWGMRCISDLDWEAGMGLSAIGGWDYA